MIFHRDYPAVNEDTREPRPVSQVFLDSQKRTEPPYGIVFQADHARLAGELAAILRPEAFSLLPAEVVTAIGTHDGGWQSGDDAQIRAIATQPPRPFPRLPRGESLPFWRRSVALARDMSPLIGVIVSRHFCALALQDPERHSFLEEEVARRGAIERTVGVAPQQLDRWTAAIGFCDILSLYLCSGSTEPVEMPLAHPALPDARDARKVGLRWSRGRVRFSSMLLKPGTLSLQMQERFNGTPQLNPRTVSWMFDAFAA